MSFQKNILAVRCFAGLMKFANWLQNLPNLMTPPPFRLIQIGSAFWQSRALYVAVRLDIAGVLGDDVLSADTIAERVSADADAVFRLLRMLAAMGIFAEVSPRDFKNNRLSAYLRPDHPNSVRAMILMHNSAEMSRPWFEQLEDGVRNGLVPFESQHGKPLYAYMSEHAEFDALFADAMDGVEALSGDSFAADFDWGRFERVIDVGGSKGSKSMAILKRHPGMTALVFDRESVVREAEQYWQAKADTGLLNRMDFLAGDLLDSVPKASGEKEIYLLSAVLHGMDDEECIKVLRNLADASAGTGVRVAVLELVLPDTRTDLAAASFDMQMFMATRGRERTISEWQALFERSGWMLEERVGLRFFGEILLLREGCSR